MKFLEVRINDQVVCHAGGPQIKILCCHLDAFLNEGFSDHKDDTHEDVFTVAINGSSFETPTSNSNHHIFLNQKCVIGDRIEFKICDDSTSKFEK